MDSRNESFQRLKPACVALSQATLSFNSNRKTGGQVTACLEDLSEAVSALGARPDHLDPKLADYVFFPISQVLKASRDLPVRAMELCLQSLAILISKGWRENIDTSLSSQLVIFLSLTCDTSGKTVVVSQVTDELLTLAYTCLTRLFEALHTSHKGKLSLVDTANVPSLGHAVSVILDGISDGSSFEVQAAAAQALEALLPCIGDIQVLSSFFPGIVSVLTKVLTPNTKARRSWRILAQSLRFLDSLILSLLSNRVVATFPKTDASPEDANGKATKLSLAWSQATASQFKIALANIERLRSHDRLEVRECLARLNLTIVEDCNHSLENCCHLALGTLLMLLEQDSSSLYAEKARLEALVSSNPKVAETLASVFHDELLSLTRIMQSNDDQAKERALKATFSAYNMLAETDSDMRTLSRMLWSGLGDSVSAILRSTNDKATITSPQTSPVMSDLIQYDGSSSSVSFPSPLARYKNQSHLLGVIQAQLEAVNEMQLRHGMATELVSSLRTSEGDSRVASFWLILQGLRVEDATDSILSSFIATDQSPVLSSVREQLYSYSMDIVTDTVEDWRLQTLALETIAMQAIQEKENFRGELSDALYPILHLLGSETAQVRGHAMTCLNIVSEACGYADVKDLVVSNVDYLVNAVALKLNAFDVSPQAPQVLLMMVRLAGPSLLPYLEDTLESIFAALEDYHGYPALVTLLFAVLKTIAEEGVKSPQLQIQNSESVSRAGVSSWAPMSVHDLINTTRENASKSAGDESTALPNSVPQKPWKELGSHFEQTAAEIDQKKQAEDDDDEEEEDSEAIEQTPPPAPKTYALLLKITTLTQHYLSSSSPSLRISLLALIRTTIPAIAKHEDSYLPLINTLWPEITSRLFDAESHVVGASLQIISVMCEYAGEFMRSRITALWPELVTIYRQISKEVKGDGRRHSTRDAQIVLRQTEDGYVDVSSKVVWQNMIGLLKCIVKYVGIEADMFDDMLGMLQPVDDLDAVVKDVLNEYNADAVWLAQYRNGSCAMERSSVESTGPWEFVQLVR